MTVSVAICAHPSRAQMATALSERLLAPISWDDGPLGVGIVTNHDAALRAALDRAEAISADWCVVIEDDADPIPDFTAQASLALAAIPNQIASLYFGYLGQPKRKIYQTLDRVDPHWVMKLGLTSAVCVAVKTAFAPKLLEVCAGVPQCSMTVDERYSFAAKHLGQQWVPHSYPSLCDHLDIPGVHGDCGIPRRAYSIGGRTEWLNKQLTFYEKVWNYE